MHSNVISFVALDFELRFIFTGMARITFVLRIARVDFDYPAANIAGLGIPANVVADFKVFAHVPGVTAKNSRMSSRFAFSARSTRRPAYVSLTPDPTNLKITWDWSILRCRIVSQVKEHFIHVTPAPAFGRIITLDDQVMCSMIMTGCMPTRRLIATTNLSTSPADSEMNPFATGFQTFLTAARTWNNLPDGAQMRAAFTHDWCGDRGVPEAHALAFARQ
jgi:hypothetical protein